MPDNKRGELMMTLTKRYKGTKGSKKCLLMLSFFAFLSVFAVENTSAAEDLYKALRVVKPKSVKPAPVFTLKGLKGGEINLEDLKGKTVLLHFWATWCKPCIKEMPTMEKFYNTFKDKNFEILAVSIDRGNVKGVESFVNMTGMTFPVLLDQDQTVRKKYFINGLPTSYLIDNKGKMKGFISGERDWSGEAATLLMNSIIKKSNS